MNKNFAKSIIEDPSYRRTLIDRAAAGTLNVELELLIWDLAFERVSTVKDPKVALMRALQS